MDDELFYQSGATHAVTSNGLVTHIKIDLAFDYLRIGLRATKSFKDAASVKSHLQHVIRCIDELEKETLIPITPHEDE